MKNLFVSYETAKILKEKGFNEPCFRFYDNVKCLYAKSSELWCYNEGQSLDISAPTYQQVVDWFREKHRVVIGIKFDVRVYTAWQIEIIALQGLGYMGIINIPENELRFNTYYEALNKAIEHSLTLI